jgi:P4 family phage/plasmid primase-like protien
MTNDLLDKITEAVDANPDAVGKAFEPKEMNLDNIIVKSGIKPPSIAEVRETVIELITSDGNPHQFISERDCFLFYDNIEGYWKLDIDNRWITDYVIMLLKTVDYIKLCSAKNIADMVAKYKMICYDDMLKMRDYNHDYAPFSRKLSLDVGDIILFNVNNGVVEYNLFTKSINLLPFNSAYRFTSRLNLEYDKEAKAPQYMTALKEVVPDQLDRRLFKHFMAYSFVNNFFEWQACMFLYGDGANGKGTIMQPWMNMFNNYSSMRLDQMADDKHGTAGLIGKEFIYASESNKTVTDTSAIKTLIVGEPITVNPKFQRPYETIIDAKVVITANKLPNLQQDSELRRFIIVRCPNKFVGSKDDTGLAHRLEQEKSGIFNWCIESLSYLIDKIQELKTGISDRSASIIESFRDPVGIFIERYTYENLEGEVSTTEIRRAYEAFRFKFQADRATPNVIGRRLTSFYGKNRISRFNYKGSRGYRGFELFISKLNDINPNWNSDISEHFADPPLEEPEKEGDNMEIRRRYRDEVLRITAEDLTPMTKLFEMAETFNIDVDYVEDMLKQWLTDGTLFCPKEGIVAANR